MYSTAEIIHGRDRIGVQCAKSALLCRERLAEQRLGHVKAAFGRYTPAATA